MNRREKKNKVMRLLSLLALLSLVLVPVSLVYADCTWTQQSPATSPSAREGHAMATIGGDQVLLFGGLLSSFFYSDETWVYDLSDDAWTLQGPDIRPSARGYHAMAHIGGDQVLLFGGSDNETWLYDLSDDTWTLQSPASSPPLRRFHDMAYIGGDQVLLFGGWDGSVYYGDTWIYDLSANTWTLQSPASSPLARYNHAMAYLGGDQVLLFGGTEHGVDHNDTWVYVLGDNTWKLQSPAGPPSTRRGHAMASIGGDQVLLFAGFISGTAYDDETWVYNLNDDAWTLQSPATQPSERKHHAMASIGGGQAVLFGGTDNTGWDDETWVVMGAPPTAITLASFSATADAGGILLNWETASELDNLGFNVYRANAADGPRSQLNAALIPSRNPGSPMGAAYSWLDESASAAPGTYHYWLEAVDVSGETTLYGPVSAAAEPMPLQRLLPVRPRLAPVSSGLRGR